MGSTIVRVAGNISFGFTGNEQNAGAIVGIRVGPGETNPTSPIADPRRDLNQLDWMFWRYQPMTQFSIGGVYVEESTSYKYSSVYFDTTVKRVCAEVNDSLNLYLFMENGLLPAQFKAPKLSYSVLIHLS